MIIKKQRLAAQLHAEPRPQTSVAQGAAPMAHSTHSPESAYAPAPTPAPVVEEVSPYAVPLSPEDFETGKLPDRRRKTRETDRRQGFRREEDHMLLTRAEEEAIAIKERAELQGFEAGLEKAQAEIEKLADQMTGFLTAREQALATVSDDLAQMAIAIAQSILKTEVACDEDLVLSLVRATIQRAGRGQKSVLIKVHPTDLSRVKEAMKIESGLSASVEVLVLEDPTVDEGSCMVETQAGLVDARFSTQLEVLYKMLTTGGKA